MFNPKISVIITVYNIEKYIGECIESVLKQSIRDIEVICVNDASTDHSLEILQKYEIADNRIKIINLVNNVGPSTARNVGYRAAQGEYLYQIDGDDYIIENALEKMYLCAKENKLDLLTFSASSFVDATQLAEKYKVMNLYQRTGTYDGVMKGMELFTRLTQNNDFLGNLYCIFLNRAFFLTNNLYLLDGLYAWADGPFLFYIKAQRSMCILDTLYMRRFRENSIVTSQKTMIKFESMLVQILYEIELWKNHKFEEKTEEQLEKYFAINWNTLINTYSMVKDKNAQLRLLPQYKFAKFVFDNMIKYKNVYWLNQTNETIEQIRKYENIIIYGAAHVAQEVEKVLENNEIYNYVFAVSDNKNEKSIKGKKIYNIAELDDMHENSIVIVAVNKRHHKAIKEKLDILGFENIILVE